MEEEIPILLGILGTFIYLGYRIIRAVWSFLLKALKIGAVIGIILFAMIVYLSNGVWIL